MLISADRGSGLVLVRTTYTIAAEKEQQFLQAMARLRQSRLRTGATGWGLYQDGQNPRLFIELFSVPSWDEHLRQHRERQTGTDLQHHDDAAAPSDPPPQTGHYLAADIHTSSQSTRHHPTLPGDGSGCSPRYSTQARFTHGSALPSRSMPAPDHQPTAPDSQHHSTKSMRQR